MDGVLADFVQHIRDLNIPYNNQWHDPRDTWTPETIEGERIKTEAMHSAGFWDTIPLMPGANELFDYCIDEVGNGRVSILTAKPQPDSPAIVEIDKRRWMTSKFGSYYFLGKFPKSKFNVCSHGEKPGYIGEFDILVDDDARNGKGLKQEQFVLHKDAAHTISRLSEIINGR